MHVKSEVGHLTSSQTHKRRNSSVTDITIQIIYTIVLSNKVNPPSSIAWDATYIDGKHINEVHACVIDEDAKQHYISLGVDELCASIFVSLLFFGNRGMNKNIKFATEQQ